MKIEIITTPTFDREYKRLKKKYTSIPKDTKVSRIIFQIPK